MRLAILALLFIHIVFKARAQVNPVVNDVAAAAKAGNYTAAEHSLATYRAKAGSTPDAILALSWMARAALANGVYDRAATYAADTHKQVVAALAHRKLDAEPNLPLALGACIEVNAQALAATGKRSEAVAYLQQEARTWHATSIAPRIYKNLNLLTLAGKPAPALDIAHFLGPKPVSLAALHGHPVLLFFWAHWCSDCKAEVSILQQLNATYGPKGLVIVAPTELFGYASAGQDATPAVETAWIDQVREKYYARVDPMSVPVSAENFRIYGCSTTPTLVLIDKTGIVRLYNHGNLGYAELASAIDHTLAAH